MTRKGFTLVELLVVVSIIAILAVVIFVAINPVEIQKKTRDATRLQNLGEIHKALGLAMAEATGSAVLTSTGGVAVSSTGGSRDVDGTGYINVNISKYLATLPIDPKDGAGGTDAAGALLESIAAIPSGDPSCLFHPAPEFLPARNRDL